MEELDQGASNGLKTDFNRRLFISTRTITTRRSPNSAPCHGRCDPPGARSAISASATSAAWRIGGAGQPFCDANSIPRPVVCQPYYNNAMNRMPEGRGAAGLRTLWNGRGALQARSRARRVDPANTSGNKPAPKGTPRGHQRQAHHWTPNGARNQVERILRATIKAPCREARHHGGPVRHRLGAEQQADLSSVNRGPRATMEQWREYRRRLGL